MCKCQRCGDLVQELFVLEYFFMGKYYRGSYCDICLQTLTTYLDSIEHTWTVHEPSL